MKGRLATIAIAGGRSVEFLAGGSNYSAGNGSIWEMIP